MIRIIYHQRLKVKCYQETHNEKNILVSDCNSRNASQYSSR